MKTHFGAFLSNSIALVVYALLRGDIVQKEGLYTSHLYSELYLHFVSQVLPYISYVQWLTVWNICLRVQNHRRNDIVAWGQFLTNHGDTVTNHLIIISGKNVTNSCFSYYEHILSFRIVGKGLL